MSAVAGEMYKSDGTVTVRGSVAYCPQNPWYVAVLSVASHLTPSEGFSVPLSKYVLLLAHRFDLITV